MKKGLAAVLAAVCLFSQPVQAAESTTIEVTYEEAQELLKIAYVEGGNQGVSGQLYIMSVVLNRVADPDWPDNIHDVIYQPHQFASGKMSNAEPSAETHEALAELEKGNLVPEIVAFETSKSTVLDKWFDYAFQAGSHKFYTKKH